MSGGLDSPSVAATAKEMLARRREPFDIQAFTFVYDRLIPDQERHFSGLAAVAIPYRLTICQLTSIRYLGQPLEPPQLRQNRSTCSRKRWRMPISTGWSPVTVESC